MLYHNALQESSVTDATAVTRRFESVQPLKIVIVEALTNNIVDKTF